MANKTPKWIFADATERDAAVGIKAGDTAILLSDFSEYLYSGSGWVTSVRQEIPLTVATVNMDPGPDSTTNPTPAGGLPSGGQPGTRGENINSRIQYLEFNKSTEDEFGFSWNIVLPTSYSGNGLTVEFWISSDSVGSASAAASFAGAFERQAVPFDLDAGPSYAATQTATGTTISGVPWTTVMGTIVFTNAQIDGFLAGESGRFGLIRNQSDAYAGAVRFVSGRIYETP